MRYDRVQVLRFFAALGVVLYHSNVYLQTKRPDAGLFVRFFDHHFGWGVELFFVISGFVIAHTIERMSVAEFARRRFLRIYPTFWTAVALVLGAKWLLWGGGGPPMGDLLRALTLLPFGPISYPLAVEWSLVYEIFFYVLVCLAALGGWKRTRDVLCVVWLAAIAIDFFSPPPRASAFLPTVGQIFFSAFNLPFIIGMVIHRVHLRVPDAARTYALLFAPAIILGSDLVARTETRLLLQGLGFGALVLWAVLADRHRRLAPGNPLVALGDWSYGLYLMHVPVITILLALGAGAAVSNEALYVALAAIAVAAGSLFGAFEAAFYRWLLRVTRRTSVPVAAPKAKAA
jgi:peptidoglycan/LPS O-acetylase OafA/YrhL